MCSKLDELRGLAMELQEHAEDASRMTRDEADYGRADHMNTTAMDSLRRATFWQRMDRSNYAAARAVTDEYQQLLAEHRVVCGDQLDVWTVLKVGDTRGR